MVAYNKDLLTNTIIAEKSEELLNGNFITNEQFQKIKMTMPALKGSKNLVVRILFFLLGSFLYASICGMIGVTFLATLENDTIWNLVPILFTGMGILAMEFVVVPNMKFYKNGLDDAFVLGIILSVGLGLGLIDRFDPWLIAAAIFIIATFCYFRYLNIPALLIAGVAFVAAIAFVMINHIIYGSAVLPILLAVLAFFCYRYFSKLLKSIRKPFYFQGVLVVKTFSTVLFYISLNYAVITELSAVLMPSLQANTFSTLMSYIFIAITAVLPVIYIYYGLKKKDKPLFIVGLLALVASYFNLRYYYIFLSVELELIVISILIFSIAFVVMKKTQNNLQGITFLADRLSTSNSAQLEVLASIAQFGHNATVTETNPMEFGGGGFSGGGAGESF